ncbi:hypothetical protein HJ590_05010 [Naumannella sp. ID2617S]|nr:hypothetical protein [Naumannella sp. ID2617S]
MTFFMNRLAQVLSGEESTEEVPTPTLRPSRPGAVNEGVDKQIALRALAEQLVCEANAVIDDPAAHLTLHDEVGGNELSFTIRCGVHAARVTTVIDSAGAHGQIVSDNLPNEEPYELIGPEALPDLIIRLCLVADLRNHHRAHLI